MGAPAKGMKAVDDSTAAEALLSAFEDIAAAERRKHATVFNYWLSIRGDRHFPPIHPPCMFATTAARLRPRTRKGSGQ